MLLWTKAKRSIKQGLLSRIDRSPTVTYLTFRMTGRCWFEDRKLLLGVYNLNSSGIYDGASP